MATPNIGLVGIFVGGSSTRMRGRPKGLLEAPDSESSLVERLDRIVRETLDVPVVLVGAHPAYASLGIEALADDPPGIGPLGGLRALLFDRRGRDAHVVAIACDLPYVDATLLGRLAAHAPEALAVAPKPEGIWQPLFARYETAAAREALRRVTSRGERALFRVLDELGTSAAALPLEAGEERALDDWDRPEDVGRR